MIPFLFVAAPPEVLTDLTAFVNPSLTAALIAALVWFWRYYIRNISSGEWVPRRELDYMIERFQERLADKDAEIGRERETSSEWRSAHETSERTRELQAGQIRDLVEAVRANGHFYDALRASAGNARREADPDGTRT